MYNFAYKARQDFILFLNVIFAKAMLSLKFVLYQGNIC